MTGFVDELERGDRFAFGENWSQYLTLIDEERIQFAETSLRRMLEVEDFRGGSFLDLGSGSGLFSLAARRLGARVHSCDYDALAVACALELRTRYVGEDPDWRIERGSAIDPGYMNALPKFDFVYSWGVLHHTGAMWKGIELALERVADAGALFIAIYNDQGRASRAWRAIKRTYNRLPVPLRFLVLWPSALRMWGPTMVRDLISSGNPARTLRNYSRSGRGMSVWRDVVDWVGGYPFEVARPEEVIDFVLSHGFELRKLTTQGGGLGCNEFVFRRRVNTTSLSDEGAGRTGSVPSLP